MSSGECVAENVIDADHQVTVLVSCYNDQPVVAKVVKVAADLRVALPTAVAARVERLRALAEVRGRS
jgi:hypothetical protein